MLLYNRAEMNIVWATVLHTICVWQNLSCITLSKEGEYDYLSATT